MKVAIISDSHYSVDKVKKLLTHLDSIGIKQLIHAGDFMGQGIEDVLAGYPDITMWIARGNCDYSGRTLDILKGFKHVHVREVLRFELETKRFLVAHIPGVALEAQKKERADVIIHGHTHRVRIEQTESCLILNPGSLMEGDGFVVLDLPGLEVDRRFNF